MEKFTLASAMRNLKRNIPLLVSTLAALCLFLAPSTTVILLEAAIFLVAVLAVCLSDAPVTKQRIQPTAVILTAAFVITGFFTFYKTWMSSSYTTILCAIVRIPARKLVPALAGVGSAAAVYAFSRLARWFDMLIGRIFSGFQGDLKSNWFFPLSAAFFFYLEAEKSLSSYWLSILVAAAVALLVAARTPSLWKLGQNESRFLHSLAALTAAGICLFRINAFTAVNEVRVFAGIAATVAAFPFVWVCVTAFLRKLRTVLTECGTFSDMTRGELAVWGGLLLAVLIFVTVTFLQTDAFYGTGYPYDVIYTSDSPMLVQNNTYLALNFQENDLRQPLFAVFAAPFMGIPYLLSRLLNASEPLNALLMNYAQIALLFFTTFLLTKLLKLDSTKRLCFLILSCCSYPFLLFTLMMEQYIVAYFYLILFLYLYCEKKQPQPFTLWGAGGTLLTSVILLPLLSKKHPVREFRLWFREMLELAMGFVLAMLAFGRMDVILNIATSILELTQFTGESLSFMDKFRQYTAFIPACFFAPAAGVAPNILGSTSWQLQQVTALDFRGIGILLVALGSAVLNWSKPGSRVAAGWIGFSFPVLVILGWGTQENGLILYALYFGWAFLVLLYQLVEKLGDMLRVKFLIPTVTIIAVAALAIVNFPALAEMITFAVSCFPL